MTIPALSLAGVTKRFGGLTAVNNVSFDVNPGEVMGLMGPNGAGKTTLLNIIAGEYAPDAGTIELNGRDITGVAPHRACRLGIARTYQVPQPFSSLTALENVLVAARYGGNLSSSAALKEASRLLDLVGLGDRKEMPAGDMLVVSLKRLSMAQALATNPSILLLDEVAGGLTEEEIPEMLDLIRAINGAGVTIVLIEHVMKVMVQSVHRIVVMDKGSQIAQGSPEAVMRDRAVIEAYFGC